MKCKPLPPYEELNSSFDKFIASNNSNNSNNIDTYFFIYIDYNQRLNVRDRYNVV